MMLTARRGALAAAFVCSTFTAAFAADTYVTKLDGASAQSGSSAIGVVSARFDSATHMLSYRVSYSGMSGAPSALVIRTAARGIVVPVGAVSGKTIVGSARLTDADVRALAQGRVYFGLRGGSASGGEIGGQVAMTGVEETRGAASDASASAFEARRPDAAASNR